MTTMSFDSARLSGGSECRNFNDAASGDGVGTPVALRNEPVCGSRFDGEHAVVRRNVVPQ